LVSSNLYRWRDANDRTFRPIFLTLTFKEQTITVSSARRLYRLFILRMAKYRKKIDGQGNKYISVMEFTKRGVPHFHIFSHIKTNILTFFHMNSFKKRISIRPQIAKIASMFANTTHIAKTGRNAMNTPASHIA